MKKLNNSDYKINTIVNLLFTCIVSFFLVYCTPKHYDYVQTKGYTQGSTFRVTYENSAGKNYSTEIDSILKCIDNSLSIYNKQSIISRINANDSSVETDELFRSVFEKSFEVYKNTNGAFDITVGPLVEAWGFGPDSGKNTRKSYIDSVLRFIGMDKVYLLGRKVHKSNPRMHLDVNAIAQGFSVDVVCKFLGSSGIKNYLVEIGGEVRSKGYNSKGKLWRVGIDKPSDDNFVSGDQIQAVIEISDKAIATSGNYRKFYIENGIKYSHTIDPKTGYPAKNNLLSASIIADDCTTADAYATACMVMGLRKSIKFLENNSGLDAYLIYSDSTGKFCEYLTRGAAKINSH
jgi:FAD:protein FMN transferase